MKLCNLDLYHQVSQSKKRVTAQSKMRLFVLLFLFFAIVTSTSEVFDVTILPGQSLGAELNDLMVVQVFFVFYGFSFLSPISRDVCRENTTPSIVRVRITFG